MITNFFRACGGGSGVACRSVSSDGHRREGRGHPGRSTSHSRDKRSPRSAPPLRHGTGRRQAPAHTPRRTSYGLGRRGRHTQASSSGAADWRREEEPSDIQDIDGVSVGPSFDCRDHRPDPVHLPVLRIALQHLIADCYRARPLGFETGWDFASHGIWEPVCQLGAARSRIARYASSGRSYRHPDSEAYQRSGDRRTFPHPGSVGDWAG